MKKNILFIFLIINCCSLFSLSPDWILNREKQFPKDKYISSIGEGSSRESAKYYALAELAAFFTQKVESSIKSDSLLINYNDELLKKESLEKSITVTSVAELLCVEYTDYFFNKREKKWFVCAYINRSELWTILSKRLELLEASFVQINQLMVKEKEPFKKIMLLKEHLNFTADFESFYYMALVINPEGCGKYLNVFLRKNELKQKLKNLKQHTGIHIRMNNENMDEIKIKLQSILAAEGFLSVQKGARYFFDVKINLNQTFFNGIYSCIPQLTVNFIGPDGIINSFSWVLDKISSYNEMTLRRIYIDALENLLDERFLSECIYGGKNE